MTWNDLADRVLDGECATFDDALSVLRSADDELLELSRRAWLHRADRYSELRAEWAGAARPRRIEMYRIGG